ncbi:MAG TPA: hypothetical protein PLL94_00860 [Bacteroidales bacterium]|jgi:hypothetical protein|nr:hypothetical protein [Bacteroidales bacterium]HOU00942.1 hypothetical protein [Bacteroidales bacterium]HQK66667.1 hypothetical protein [Bacteroidales bacterium]
MKKIFNILLLGIIICCLTAGCKKDKGDPPTLPPLESFNIDFSNFQSGKKSENIILQKGVENSNWEIAAGVAGYFRALIITTLAVPVLAFDKALDQKPVYLEEKTWQWSYSVSLASVTYKARLTGEIRTSDVKWEMYITKEGTGGFAEFLWFEGTSRLDGTGGQWTLNHSSQFQEPLLKIDWTKTGSTVNYIKYTYERTLDNNRNTDPFKSSYIEYGRATGTFDSYYNIHYYNGLKFSEMNVEWNSTTHNGHVKCFDLFGDNSWHCWDGNYINITC